MNEMVFGSNNINENPSNLTRTVFAIGAAWFLLVLVTAISGGFNYSAGERPLSILLAVTLPVIVFSTCYFSIPSFKEWVLAIDMRRLILLHSWRMIGMGFVFLYFQDRLPALFALPAGIGDAMAAIGAVFLGIALYENKESVSKSRIWQWNAFGLIDFFLAVSLGVLTRTGEVLHTHGQVGSDLMGSFPTAIVPGFFVPMYIITHLIIFAQLRRR